MSKNHVVSIEYNHRIYQKVSSRKKEVKTSKERKDKKKKTKNKEYPMTIKLKEKT